jgi:hypothetical protein
MYMMLQEVNTSAHTNNTHHFGKYGEGGNTVVHADLAHPEMKALYELVGTLNV